MKRKQTTQPQTVYALQTIGYKGATPQTQFTFTAANDDEAKDKAIGWAHYQGMVYREDVNVTPATGNELQWETHNEWMNH
jgi:hypothetical protein